MYTENNGSTWYGVLKDVDDIHEVYRRESQWLAVGSGVIATSNDGKNCIHVQDSSFTNIMTVTYCPL